MLILVTDLFEDDLLEPSKKIYFLDCWAGRFASPVLESQKQKRYDPNTIRKNIFQMEGAICNCAGLNYAPMLTFLQ